MTSAPTNATRSMPAIAWLGGAVLLAYWITSVRSLGGMWSALPEYSYGWFVPMLCCILFADRWRSRPEGNRSGQSRMTVMFVVLAAVVFALARLALQVIPAWRVSAWALGSSVVLLTWCGLWFAGGGAWLRHFSFPVIFFLLAIPWPNRFEDPFIQMLTELNASVTVEIMSFLKVAAVRMGNIILIEPGMVGVQEACSGIRSFQSTLMVALFLGELFRFTFWRRIVFVMAGAFLSFSFNSVRTSFLVWTCNREGLQAVDKFHDPAGWSILAASVAGLAVIGWWLNRQQKRAGGGTPTGSNPAPAAPRSFQLANAVPMFALVFPMLALVGTEFGSRWWFAIHQRPHLSQTQWSFHDGRDDFKLQPLKITREVQTMLSYDRGEGWEWQAGGGERWQAFYFVWDAPKTLAREITATSAALGHQPEICFTRAGMQLRQVYGRKRYLANDIPLVFKVYEFADRNIPIYVFACTWERNAEQTTADTQAKGDPGTLNGVRQAARMFLRGERGINDEVRVLKFGVWGPRSIGEAEAAFQMQLNMLVAPKAGG